MRRLVPVLITLSTLLLGSCGGGDDDGRAHVLVGSEVPNIKEGSEWEKELERLTCSDRGWNWESKYSKYSQSLVMRASQAGLDSNSLSNVLQVILADARQERHACLPFGAFRLEREGQPVWSVCLVWGYLGGADQRLCEYCAYTIHATTFRKMDFYTCL